MKFAKNYYIWYIMATLLCFLFGLLKASNEFSLEQAIEQQLNKEHHQHQNRGILTPDNDIIPVLNRKRRYLEFPEGSSFQLVYDLIVGVVDFTNYLILGVTVALAWELPSKPPSEILEDLTTRLKDGTLGTSRNDTIENINYVDIKSNSTDNKTPLNTKHQYKLQPMFRPPMHYQYYAQRTPDSYYKYQRQKPVYASKYNKPNLYNPWSRKDNQYYSHKQPHPFVKWTQFKNQPKYSVKGTRYPWWNLPHRLQNSLMQRPSIRRFDQNYNKSYVNLKKAYQTYSTYPGTGRAVTHRIYPVFGKRSILDDHQQNENRSTTHTRFRRSGIIGDKLSNLDRIHLDHHRKTRHDLYQRIEIYLNGRGSHGHHCVLRALCETGQKSHEHQPGSFVGELMRAIFTMPEPFGETKAGYKEQRYDAANALKSNCASRYTNCKDSLWSSHLVL